jgi:hypothetical protein
MCNHEYKEIDCGVEFTLAQTFGLHRIPSSSLEQPCEKSPRTERRRCQVFNGHCAALSIVRSLLRSPWQGLFIADLLPKALGSLERLGGSFGRSACHVVTKDGRHIAGYVQRAFSYPRWVQTCPLPPRPYAALEINELVALHLKYSVTT